jgi:hypothetical protein
MISNGLLSRVLKHFSTGSSLCRIIFQSVHDFQSATLIYNGRDTALYTHCKGVTVNLTVAYRQLDGK